MSDASLPHCEKCNEPEYACICGGEREDSEYYLDALEREDRKDREERLKELMSDLLTTIREYSDRHEKPNEILFVLDLITDAYRDAFESTTGQRIQWPERPRGNGAKLS
jgi:hypothetical protein